MWLLDTTKIKLQYFQNDEIPKYAILSHRWDRTEVSFQDLQKGSAMPGYAKIEACCNQAVSDGLLFAWIDCCCIDKSSSAELSEAINSMYRWYQNATVCYAYLSDVPETDEKHEIKGSAFRNSKWFTRGWTLQELLAPERVIFFNQKWIEIGTKASMESTITSITGINNLTTFEEASVAQKMSWASSRQTTRVEDTAYCLMGIFGVNMAPLYGEKENAFRRLQLEIISRLDDESIFAWVDELGRGIGGLLARSPSCFKYSGDIIALAGGKNRLPFSMTNRGLCIELELDVSTTTNDAEIADPTFQAPINCKRQDISNLLSLSLIRAPMDRYVRLTSFLNPYFQPERYNNRNTTRTLYVWQPDSAWYQQADKNQHQYVFSIQAQSVMQDGFTVHERLISCEGPRCHSKWEIINSEIKLILDMSDPGPTFYGVILFKAIKPKRRLAVILQVDERYRPEAEFLTIFEKQSLRQAVEAFYTSRVTIRDHLYVAGVSSGIKRGLVVTVASR